MTNVPQSPDLLTLARANDPVALETMFRQFINENEELIYARFLGRHGVFGFGPQCFAAVTNRRVASIQFSRFGEVVYQDGFLNKITSSVVYQPSLLWLIVMRVLVAILAIPTLGLALLLGPWIASLFYKLQKSGVLFYIGDGIPVFLFCDRKLIRFANELQRYAMDLAQSDQESRRTTPGRKSGSLATIHSEPVYSAVSPDYGLAKTAIYGFLAALSLGLVAVMLAIYAEYSLFDTYCQIGDEADRAYAISTGREAPYSASMDTDSEIIAYMTRAGLSEDERLVLGLWREEHDAVDRIRDRYYFVHRPVLPLLGVIAGFAVAISLILTIVWLCRTNSRLPEDLQVMDTRSLAFLLSVPFVNLIVAMVVIPKLASKWSKYAADTGLRYQSAPRGIAVAISCTLLIPYVNPVVSGILMVVFVYRMERLKLSLNVEANGRAAAEVRPTSPAAG